ncbi:MAG: hypothetical protein K6A32_06005, partial [Bacteroidales bacterium]|nr:hypothetical protein [Bacteroidales bacterium]
MRSEDIDKKIGMPDVDAEWAKFEREVMDEEAQPRKRTLAPWAWGIGIAASIAVVAGLFLFGNGPKGTKEGSVAMAEENKSEATEVKGADDGNAEKAVGGNGIEKAVGGAIEKAVGGNGIEKAVGGNGIEKAVGGNAEKAVGGSGIEKQSGNLLAEAEPAPKEGARRGQEASASAPVQDVTEDDFSVVEEQPHFPGGDKALMDFIKKNLRYPALAQAYVTKGRVLMSMKIDTLGQVSDIKAQRFMLDYVPSLLSQASEAEQTELKAGISRQLEEECARVIALMPTWQPGRVMGKRTNMKYYIPFTLQPELLAKARESEMQDPLQVRIAGLNVVPNASNLGSNAMRLTGTSARDEGEKDSILVVVDGEAMLLAILYGNRFMPLTKEYLERILEKDIESIIVYKDEDNKRPYVEKYGELAKKGVVDIQTKSPRTYEYEGLANAARGEALQGRIAGLDLDNKPTHFVTETKRPALPNLWERDTVLTLVNGKEDSDFLRYLSSTSHVSMSNIYDYFFERNQLYLK